ncbi:MAG TPA: hypothetical protein VJM09_01305, partial [Sphingobium sp.]|nr:hypothetical protein [Sphingobium sp.]
IVPDNVPAPIRGALFLIGLAAGLAAIAGQGRRALERAKRGRAAPSLLAIPLGFFFFTYLGFMVLATSIEANLHLNSRYAYPIYVTSVMAVTIAVAGLHGARAPAQRLRLVLAGIACLMLVGHAVRTGWRTGQAYRDGVGYAALSWTRSPTLAAISRLPKDAILYSNGADAIGYVLRRPARSVPAHIELRTGRDEAARPYAAQLAEARATLARGNAYVVFLNGVTWRFYMAGERELAERLKLVLVARLADGAIYRSAEPLAAGTEQ